MDGAMRLVVLLAGGGAMAATGLIFLALALARERPAVRPTPPNMSAVGVCVALGLLCVLVGVLDVRDVLAGRDEPQTMQAACRDAARYASQLSGVVDWAAADALEAAGFSWSLDFEGTPWAAPGVAYSWEATSRDDMGVGFDGGRRLHRYQENARYRVFADGIPGALEGEAQCHFVQDVDTGEFWFHAGDWLLKGDPSVRVFMEYNENGRRR